MLDEAGFFEWAALHVARRAGAAVRPVRANCLAWRSPWPRSSNDGAALILAPIVMAMLLALGFTPAATLAFVMAAGFIADTARLPLTVSDLVNIVPADFFDISFNRYAALMALVNIVSVAASLLVLFLYLRKSIPARCEVSQLNDPVAAIRNSGTFRAGWAVLVLPLWVSLA